MPDNARISSVINEDAVNQEIKNLIEKLHEAGDVIKKFPEVTLKYKESGSASEMRKNQEALVKINNDAKKSVSELELTMKQYQTVLNQNAVAQAKLNTSQSEAGKQLAATKEQQRQVNAEIKNQIELQRAAENSINKALAANKLALSERNSLNLATEEGKKRQAELNAEIDKNNDFIRENVDALSKQKINIGNYPTQFASAFKVLEAELAKVRKQLADPALSGPQLEELKRKEQAIVSATALVNKEFTTATAEVKAFENAAAQVGTRYDKKSEVFKSFTAEVKTGTTAVKATNAAVKETIEGGKGIAGSFSKGFGVVRQLANILPGLGISGILLLAFESLQKLFGGFDLFKEKVQATKASVETLNEAMAGTEYTDAIKNVKLLTINMDLAKKGLIDKKDVLEQYNSTVGKVAGQVGSLDEAEKALVKNGDAYIKMTLYKAAANIALGKAAQKALEIEQEELKSKSDSNYQQGIGTDRTAAEADIRKTEGYAKKYEQVQKDMVAKKKGFAYMNEQLDAYVDEQVKGRLNRGKIDEQNQMEELATSLQTKGAELAKKFKFNFNGDADNGSKTKKEGKPHDDTNEALAAQKALIDAKAKLSRLDLENDAKAQQAILENENEALDKRLIALAHFTEDKRQLAIKDSQTETAEIELKLGKIAEIEKKSVKSRTNEEKNLLLYKDSLLIEKQTAEKKCNGIIQDLEREHGAKMKDIQKQSADGSKKDILASIDDEKAGTVAKNFKETSEALEALNQKFEEGKITVDEYEKRKEKLTKASDIANLEAEKTALEETLAVYAVYGMNAASVEMKLTDIKQKLRDKDLEGAKKAAKEKEQLEKEVAEKTKANISAAYDLGVALIDGGFERRQEKIQKEIDATTKWKDAEIERINSSSLSEQDKANKLVQVNAAAQAKQEQLQARQREEKLKQAKFDKEAAVLKLFAETFVQAAAAGFITPKAIAIEIAGALAIGALLAKPLPKYADGVDSHPGGLAILGDGGEHELVTMPDGSQFVSPDTDTLYDLPKGTSVKPLEDNLISWSTYTKMMERMALGSLEKTTAPTGGDAIKAIMQKQNEIAVWQTNELKKAFGKQKAPVVTIYNNSDWNHYIQKQIKD